MRRSLIILALGLTSCFATAQAPQAISYQAAARDLAGNALADQLVSVRFRVHQSAANGTVVYGESHSTTTSPHGLFSLSVGLGVPESGDFSSINWALGPYFLEVALDTIGGSNYVLIGSQQLLSVPYALHAGGVDCPTVSLVGDTLKQANGCFVIIPGISAANNPCPAEVCGDGIDNDCDGQIDEGCVECTPGQVETCGDDVGLCTPGSRTCTASSTWGPCVGAILPSAEVCNGIDDDCDGQVDEGLGVDGDGDGFTPCAGDCNDADPSVFPGQGCVGCSSLDLAIFASPYETWGPSVDCIQDCPLFINDPDFVNCRALCYAANGLGVDCAACLVEYQLCLGTQCAICATDPISPACIQCQQTSGCAAQFTLCSGLVDNDLDGEFAPFDCDDNNAMIGPNRDEICGNGVDDDCDGTIDENLLASYPDADGDGSGEDAGMTMVCTILPGQLAIGGDCNDGDPNISPSAVEVCDGIDNDCNGQIDEGCITCTVGEVEACGNGTGACVQGSRTCIAENQWSTVWGPCTGAVLPTAEVCNGLDDDCDGQIDESGACGPECTPSDMALFASPYETWGPAPSCLQDCPLFINDPNYVNCRALCYAANGLGVDCAACLVEYQLCIIQCAICQTDPASAACLQCQISSGCHAQFTNCSGLSDNDLDGYFAPFDCNDDCFSCHADATEVCADGIDNDCDGQLDEGCAECTPGQVEACGSDIGACVEGSRTCTASSTWGPCIGEVLPAAEVCNGLDDNCDGQVDEGNVCDPCSAPNICTISGQCYSNGQVNPGSPCLECNTAISATSWSSRPAGTVCGASDCIISTCNGSGTCVQVFRPAGTACNDGNANTTNDICNGAGSCSGTPCPDLDADGFSTCSGDCDDANAATNPGATETCGDGVDNNCNGQVDENCGSPEICDGIDNDSDGQVDEGLGLGQACGCGGVVVCDGQGGTTCSQPAPPEVCGDGIDNDCDGQVDEGCAGTQCGFFNGTQQGNCPSGFQCVNGFCVP